MLSALVAARSPMPRSIDDWLHLPGGAAAWSLYAPLHDAVLLPRSRWSPAARELTLALRPTPQAVEAPSGDGAWTLTVEGVESLRLAFFRDLPGVASARGFEESASWSELAAGLAATRCDVLDAELTRDARALHLQFSLAVPYRFGELWVRGTSVVIRDPRDQPVSVEELIALGERRPSGRT